MSGQNILRVLLFIVFFSIGAAALACSILSDDLLRYYQNKQILKESEELLEQLESLNIAYDALLERMENDANLVRRIAPAALGVEPADGNAIYPRAPAEQLAAAREALTEHSAPGVVAPTVPAWLIRCSEPYRRVILFLAGAFLILISFTCFGGAKEIDQKEMSS